MAQNFLFGPIGANAYRVARERQDTRGQAAVAGILRNVIPYVGNVATAAYGAYKDKKAYGKAAV